ncbi:MAG TPA: hypothetical protein VJQ45_02730, partial [Ktedonobacterales bacterium]|nr:hypothetical protein [Ktedonobacterales bacterium]
FTWATVARRTAALYRELLAADDMTRPRAHQDGPADESAPKGLRPQSPPARAVIRARSTLRAGDALAPGDVSPPALSATMPRLEEVMGG